MSASKLARWSPYLLGIGFGTSYGVIMRWIVGGHRGAQDTVLFGVMTLSFLFVVPVAIGFLAARPLSNRGALAYAFLGWIPTVLSVAVAWIAGWEGMICITLGLPVMFLLSTAGGLIAWTMRDTRATSVTLSSIALPFLVWPVEHALGVPTSLRTVASEITIDADPSVVWKQIVRVPAIAASELTPSLATRLGFPRPIEATLDREGVGGVRRATFEGGVLFLETITQWDEERALSFSIAAQTESIPPTTLDEHVTIGGPYFDVLQGTYTIEKYRRGVVLHLESRLRVSTPFNLYSGPWADAIMASIQEQILRVLKNRCERP